MKKITFFTIFLAVLALGFHNTGIGQVLMNENFDYPMGDLITAHGWIGHSGTGTQPITVTSGLTFPGYVGSAIGNAALADNTGEDDHANFTVQTSGVIYTSLMVNVTTTAAGYFFHLGGDPLGTIFRGKVFMNATNHFGISVGSNTGTFAASTYTPGTTCVLVIKYEIVAGTNNDIVSLFVFDAAIPATEPVATVGPLTDATMTDINPASVSIRQFIASQNVTIDGIRVATSWNELFAIVPQPIPTMSEWALILLGAALVGVGAFYIMRRRNSSVAV
jgi:hypothetical protein